MVVEVDGGTAEVSQKVADRNNTQKFARLEVHLSSGHVFCSALLLYNKVAGVLSAYEYNSNNKKNGIVIVTYLQLQCLYPTHPQIQPHECCLSQPGLDNLVTQQTAPYFNPPSIHSDSKLNLAQLLNPPKLSYSIVLHLVMCLRLFTLG